MTYVRVQVKSGARTESVIQTDEKTYSMSIKEHAKHEQANDRVRQLLAEELGVRIHKIRLVSGVRSPRKIFDID